MLSLVVGAHPHTEARQGGGEGGNAEGQGLQRGVSPGLVIGGEQGQVHSAEEVVIGHIEHPVVSIEVRRDEIHLHLVSGSIGEPHFAEPMGDGIVFRVHQDVGRLRAVLRIATASQAGHQFPLRTVVAGRNHNESLDAAALVIRVVDPGEGIDENVNTLVVVFVAAANADKEGIGGHLLRTHGRRHLYQAVSGGVVQLHVLLVRRRGKAVLEAVGRHHIHRASQELGALLGRDLAHRGEGIGILGRCLFQGIDGRHVEAAGHLVSVILLYIIIEGKVVAGEASSHHRGVGGEDRGHGHIGLFQLKHTGAGLPLVELGHHLFSSLEIVVAEALYHAAGQDTEHGRFLIVPVAGEGIHSEVFPEVSQDGIGLREMLLVIHQDGQGLSGNVPSSHAEDQSFAAGLLLPGAVQHRVFQEIRVAGAVHPDIGADEDVPPAQLGLQMECLGGNHGIDTAHLVTHFPTNLKQVIRLYQLFLFCHRPSTSSSPS